MSEHSVEYDATCAHQFVKDGWQRWETWLPRRKWRCVACGFKTRTYDAVDHMAMRPVHPHMSVAVPGFNTCVTPPAKTHSDPTSPSAYDWPEQLRAEVVEANRDEWWAE